MLELGGKSPALIMEDADLAQAANTCIMGGKSPENITLLKILTFL